MIKINEQKLEKIINEEISYILKKNLIKEDMFNKTPEERLSPLIRREAPPILQYSGAGQIRIPKDKERFRQQIGPTIIDALDNSKYSPKVGTDRLWLASEIIEALYTLIMQGEVSPSPED